jgi:HlyD family secretion protein
MKKIAFFTIFGTFIALFSCKNTANVADATGQFEAQEVIISAESAGVLRQFSIAEGQNLTAGQEIGAIDCTQLGLQKDQISATERALDLRKTEAGPQTQILQAQIQAAESQILTQKEQLRVVQIEQSRLQKLVAAQAAPAKNLDDVNGQIAVLEKQIMAAQGQIGVLRQQIQSQNESANIANRGILSEKQPLSVRKAQIDDQINRCRVINPIKGTVLTKYAEQFEMAAPGKALYKIANLENLTLRAYVTGDQLPNLKLGQTVKINVAGKDYSGKISWISDKAEFTPKSIQTKNERANLVYAVKIEAPNDGFLKIGMFGDVNF